MGSGNLSPPASLRAQVVDLFLLLHFVDHMLVMLVYRDFWVPPHPTHPRRSRH